MSMDTEEMIKAQPMDACIIIGGCDKTVPAQLMGGISANKPVLPLVRIRSDPNLVRGGAVRGSRKIRKPLNRSGFGSGQSENDPQTEPNRTGKRQH